jgi:NAD(P)-dependent dehydrogenase (short-subunit alcohol dehydrogenase family)
MTVPTPPVVHAVTLPPATAKAARAWGAPLNPPMVDWAGKRVWLIGASSGIGYACAQTLARAGAHVVVSARKLPDVAGQPHLYPVALDVTDPVSVQTAKAWVMETVLQNSVHGGPLDLVVYCAGHYRAQRATDFDLKEMLRHQEVNYVGALQVLDAVLPLFLAQGRGHISLVSSVAGWSGLPNGLAYGPTKAALTHLAESLYLDLQDRGLGVSVIHPGFVATPLTAQNDFEMPALITPDQAAQAMLKGWAQGAFDIHFPKRFTLWLKLMRLLPYRWYFSLVRRFTGM